MNATSAVEEKVHRDPGQEAIVLVVGHNGDLNSLCEFLGAADFCAAKGTLGVSQATWSAPKLQELQPKLAYD